jgi:hypothetical protein
VTMAVLSIVLDASEMLQADDGWGVTMRIRMIEITCDLSDFQVVVVVLPVSYSVTRKLQCFPYDTELALARLICARRRSTRSIL